MNMDLFYLLRFTCPFRMYQKTLRRKTVANNAVLLTVDKLAADW